MGFGLKPSPKKGPKTETSTMMDMELWKNLSMGKRKAIKPGKKETVRKWRDESTMIHEGTLDGSRRD